MELQARRKHSPRQEESKTPQQLRLEYSCHMGVSDHAIEPARPDNSYPGLSIPVVSAPHERIPYGFYEFFAGGGLARLGLGSTWKCLFANEWSQAKANSYRANFADPIGGLAVCDIANLTVEELPGRPDLVWASFPCQDLSLAGNGAGLEGARSGTFHVFWRLVQQLSQQNRAPRVVVLENVIGALTSHGGKDFQALVGALVEGGYHVGALTMDAAKFLPQSRPRLFWVAVRKDVKIPSNLISFHPLMDWHSKALEKAHNKLSESVKASWIWWKLPSPKQRKASLEDVLQLASRDVPWHSAEETARIVAMMSAQNIEKLEKLKGLGRLAVATIYKRTRIDPISGQKLQRAEVRDDGLAGCLRTPAGGSSRQIVLVVDGKQVRTRLLTPREAARLMGIPDFYSLPLRYNDAYQLAGDGLAIPVVAWLARHLLAPLVSCLENDDPTANGAGTSRSCTIGLPKQSGDFAL